MSLDTTKTVESIKYNGVEFPISGRGDPREVYQGTRPAEWLRLPDYDKVPNRTMYCLLALFPYGMNKVSFGFRSDGNCTISAGKVINGAFVPFENDTPVVVNGIGPYGDCTITREFNYNDYDDVMSDGTHQLVIELKVSSYWYRIWSNTPSLNRLINGGILDMIIHTDDQNTAIFETAGEMYGCRYFYNFNDRISSHIKTVEYVKTASSICVPNTRLYLPELKSFLGTVKLVSFWETFRQCTNLREVTCDISDMTGWTSPFYQYQQCNSLKKLIFIGGEDKTSFPGDIYLASTLLENDAVLNFFNSLPNISTSETARTITLTNTPAAKEGIPEETLSIATNKGWTVVTA